MYFRARSRRMTVLTASAPGGVLTGGQCWTHGSCSEMLKKKNLFLLLLLNDEVLQFSQDSIVYQFSSDNMWAAYYGVIVQLFTKVSERSPQTDKRKEQDFYIEQQTSAARFSVKVLPLTAVLSGFVIVTIDHTAVISCHGFAETCPTGAVAHLANTLIFQSTPAKCSRLPCLCRSWHLNSGPKKSGYRLEKWQCKLLADIAWLSHSADTRTPV